MGKIAFVFPGQGAQAVGMGKDVYEADPSTRGQFRTRPEALGFPLSESSSRSGGRAEADSEHAACAACNEYCAP